MTSLPCPDGVPMRLPRNPGFRPCEPQEGDELYANGIFEFNVTRLLAHIGAAGTFRVEQVKLGDIPYPGDSSGLTEHTILAADLSRPVILAEIAPGRYNLIDGHHRVAKARRQGVPRIPAHRIDCPDHVGFLTSARAYECYVDYWNGKVDDSSAERARHWRRASRGSGNGRGQAHWVCHQSTK